MAEMSEVKELKRILEHAGENTVCLALAELIGVVEASPVVPHAVVQNSEDRPERKYEAGEDCWVAKEQLSFRERVIEDPNFLPVHFLEEGAIIQRAVARVRLAAGFGTGFLVARNILMTNNHVIPTKQHARNTKAEFNYQLDFNGSAQTIDEYGLDPDDLFYTNGDLDFTIVRVAPRCFNLPFPWLPRPPISWPPIPTPGPIPIPGPQPDPVPIFGPEAAYFMGGPFGERIGWRQICTSAGDRWGQIRLPANALQFAAEQHINIIQHPQARRKEVALHKNHLDYGVGDFVRYTTDTEPGSSGSPVLNDAWDLIAIHHAGGDRQNGVWINNEGIRMDRIVTDLRANVGNAVLAELGL